MLGLPPNAGTHGRNLTAAQSRQLYGLYGEFEYSFGKKDPPFAAPDLSCHDDASTMHRRCIDYGGWSMRQRGQVEPQSWVETALIAPLAQAASASCGQARRKTLHFRQASHSMSDALVLQPT